MTTTQTEPRRETADRALMALAETLAREQLGSSKLSLLDLNESVVDEYLRMARAARECSRTWRPTRNTDMPTYAEVTAGVDEHLRDALDWAPKWTVAEWGAPDDGYDESALEERTEVKHLAAAQAVSSGNDLQHHVPMLDIDVPISVIPSSTRGHSHLLIHQELEWSDYKELLLLLARLGIIEEGYAQVSIRRGATFLRLPWIRKGAENECRDRAFAEWLGMPDYTLPMLMQPPAVREAMHRKVSA